MFPGFTRIRSWSVFTRATVAEFFGVLLFQLLGGSTRDPLAIAFTFTTIQFAFKYASGGHLNPAMSLAAAGSGHIRLHTGLVYALAQVLGGLAGAVLQAMMVPGAYLWKESISCVAPSDDITGWQLFAWEFVLTLVFVLVQYAALFVLPGHGDVAPLASGVTLYSILESVGGFTGYSPVNPARTIASTFIFNCYWGSAWIYLLAQLLAAVVASIWVVSAWGAGVYYHVPEEEGVGHGARSGTSYEETLLPGAEGAPVSGAQAVTHRDLTFSPEGLARSSSQEGSLEQLPQEGPASSPFQRSGSA